MLVLLTYIIVELAFVELDDIENFLCLLKLFDDLKVLQTVLRLDSSLTGCNELLQNRLALFTLTHRDQQVCVQGLALAWLTEDKLVHFSDQLSIRNAASTPSVHTEVTL